MPTRDILIVVFFGAAGAVSGLFLGFLALAAYSGIWQ
jgi:hypothetical protein